ncbi:MAG: T9SS type A sorting domain-containing protein [Sphingobacteriales bacterium]|nr:MAG: T9SS type A sorting domain-containing protein [Sphingobacteriales bacterium]
MIMSNFHKIIAITLLTFSLAISSKSSFGHGACNTFFNASCNGAPKWSSEARLFSFGVPQAIQITSYQCYPYLYAASVSKPWGSQWTKYTAGVGCQKSGWVKRRYQARGNEFSPLVNEFLEAMTESGAQASADTPNVEMAEVIEQSVALNLAEGTITVNGINATCRVLIGEPVQSVIRYEIWKRDSPADEKFSDDKVIYSTSIIVKGTSDVISGNGTLLDMPHQIFQEQGYRVLQVNNGSVKLPVPAGTQPDLIAIRLVSDGGGDESAMISQSLLTSSKKLSADNFGFDLFPNPANNFININLQSPVATAAQIKMYDATGRLADITVPSQDLAAGISTSVRIDTKNISLGNYYIVVQTGNAKYVQQISIVK